MLNLFSRYRKPSAFLSLPALPEPTHATDYLAGWRAFVVKLERDILPIYARHESSFDGGGVHGRMHICRSVLFAEFMARFYRRCLSAEVDFYAVRVATAFHDSGRQANGIDLWELDSAQNCRRYVQNTLPGGEAYADYVASLITKIPSERPAKDGARKDPARWVVHDADVLEIMRPCCGHGGAAGFRREHLHFAGAEDTLTLKFTPAPHWREALIQEAWELIQRTERVKQKLARSKQYFLDVYDHFARKPNRYPTLSSLLLD